MGKMREILFRGKSLDTGEWVYGWYCRQSFGRLPLKCAIITREDAENGYIHPTEVYPDTVGQFTDLNDTNGRRVFEGDILRIAKTSDSLGTYYYPPAQYPANVVVKWDLCAWMWEVIGKDKYYLSFPEAWCHYECEIIGNIHDNPELMKGDKHDA